MADPIVLAAVPGNLYRQKQGRISVICMFFIIQYDLIQSPSHSPVSEETQRQRHPAKGSRQTRPTSPRTNVPSSPLSSGPAASPSAGPSASLERFSWYSHDIATDQSSDLSPDDATDESLDIATDQSSYQSIE
jgi:hypothetical protein